MVATVACECVWLKFERVFIAFVSSAKSVPSPAQNAFIASDERVCLQCNIVFGGK